MVTTAVSVVVGSAPLIGRTEEAQTSEVGPGLIAFSIVVLLALATFFLIRSMMHHINKVPPTFDGEAGDDSSGGDVS